MIENYSNAMVFIIAHNFWEKGGETDNNVNNRFPVACSNF
jgi:hypothetical protein